ncbi:hypothetical protein NH340_JMT06088 [Sarcoptes scabiei]|nr:hypothetical protein NH340_JMT06088 [Sarcoptes scabiei]
MRRRSERLRTPVKYGHVVDINKVKIIDSSDNSDAEKKKKRSKQINKEQIKLRMAKRKQKTKKQAEKERYNDGNQTFEKNSSTSSSSSSSLVENRSTRRSSIRIEKSKKSVAEETIQISFDQSDSNRKSRETKVGPNVKKELNSNKNRINKSKIFIQSKTKENGPSKKRRPKTISITTRKEAFENALIRLHSSSIPELLPCREIEMENIFEFVAEKLITDEGGCMYISGVPGTGKTATLRGVKQKLFDNCNSLPSFKFIEINGLKLAQPDRFCSHFLLELDGIKKSNYQATDILTKRFSSSIIDKEFIILFIDELDYLKTKNQAVLYHIFDWPNRPNSRLIVLAVANSMDLPEKIFVNRVSSRLGLTRILFHPYSHKELKTIVTSRLVDLNDFEIFESDALELICRKVSAVSGDARRVLDIARRAVEICLEDNSSASNSIDRIKNDDFTKVTMRIVDKALKEIFNSLKINRIMRASIQEQIFLRAFLQKYRQSGSEEYQFIDIYQAHCDICHFECSTVPTTTDLSKVASNLDLNKIILLERSHSHLFRRIRLNISPDDIAYALNLES